MIYDPDGRPGNLGWAKWRIDTLVERIPTLLPRPHPAMHEMALADGVLRIIEDAARRDGFCRVRAVWLEIGELASVEPDAMQFCFEVAARQGIAQGARLEIEETPGRAWCIPCSESITYRSYGDACPHCGGYQIEITGGTELRVKEVEVE